MDRDESDNKHGAPGPRELEALRTLLAQGRHPEAANLAQAITERFPHHEAGWKALVGLQQRTGRPIAALAAMPKTVALRSNDTQLLCNLGLTLQTFGRLAEAEASYRRALELKPDLAEAHNNLGNVLQARGQLLEAEASFRRTLQLKVDHVAAHNNLGNVLQARGQLVEAEASYRRALELKPDLAEAHNNLGNILQARGQLVEAEASYRRALQIKADYMTAHNNLGNILQARGELVEAEASFRRALQLKPDYAEAHNNLGNTLIALGRLTEAETSFQRALQIKPDYAAAYSNLLLSLIYRTDKTAEAVFDAHRGYQARFGTPHHRGPPAHESRPRARSADRRLRVGYLSPDFRQHSVASFITPLLREHNRQSVEVFGYADVVRPDAVTAVLQGLADAWRHTASLTDAQLMERIAADEIDVLVDLAGHTARNRLPVFARQAAPIQVTWLGYPDTTGLEAMSYRLVDAVTDPPGEADRWASEELIRLEDGFLCFEPAADAMVTGAPPCVASGTITFGSFNNPAKLSSATLDAWMRILAQVAGSRLVLKGHGFADEATRKSFLNRFEQGGGDARRLDLLGFTHLPADHLAAYGQVDIALDPFPYNGTTTTCEALWMGVPTVTLLGDRHAGRVGASLLTRVGLTDLIAPTPEAYIDIAAALAADCGRLTRLRQTLRPRMRTSPLCDAQSFARKLEATYRALWQQHCVKAGGGRAEPASR